MPGNSSATCYPPLRAKQPYGNATCAGFELLCATAEVPHDPTNPARWVAAGAALGADGRSLTLTARPGTADGLLARGSRYAWADFPQATLFAAATREGGGGQPGLGLPVLPWNQALTCSGTTPLPPGAMC